MPIIAQGPTRSPRARRLYEAIRDAVDEMSLGVKLKFSSAFRDRPEWADLDEELQEVFEDVAERTR